MIAGLSNHYITMQMQSQILNSMLELPDFVAVDRRTMEGYWNADG
jgi:hypothetical protein